MNFVLAVGITAFLLTQGVQEPTERVRVLSIAPGSPAATSGMREGDIVTPYKNPQELIEYVANHKGEEITLAIIRDAKPLEVQVTPRVESPPGEGPMGVSISNLETRVYPITQAPWLAVKINLMRAREMFVGIGTLVVRLIRFEPVGADVAGPIGIAAVTGTAVKIGWKAVLEFMSILSLNLAVLNILPIPALDGGRLAFIFLEKILGRKVRPAFEQSTHQIGMIALFILIFLISINDVLRLTRGG